MHSKLKQWNAPSAAQQMQQLGGEKGRSDFKTQLEWDLYQLFRQRCMSQEWREQEPVIALSGQHYHPSDMVEL